MNNLGSLLHSMGDLAGAQPYLEGALATQTLFLGEQHTVTLRTQHNLDRLLEDLGRAKGAPTLTAPTASADVRTPRRADAQHLGRVPYRRDGRAGGGR